jgi:hypothetical protein
MIGIFLEFTGFHSHGHSFTYYKGHIIKENNMMDLT